MWCSYKDGFCINPVCLCGCVDQKTDKELQIKTTEAIAKIIAAAKEKP